MPLPDLNRGRRKAIRNLATRVCEECWRRHGRTIPVDLEQIAKDANLPVGLKHDEDRIGWIENRGGKLRIFLDPELPQTECRFTLAHELGHFFLPAHWELLMSGEGVHYPYLPGVLSTLVPEQEANYFASALLMPDPEFLPRIQENRITLDLVREFAERFGVSLQAAAIRSVEAASTACAAIVVPSGGSFSPWTVISDALTKLGVNKTSGLKAGCLHSPTSTGTALGNWFKNVPLSKQTMPFHQDVFRFGDGGVMVLLREGLY